jgi:hypothetical protein
MDVSIMPKRHIVGLAWIDKSALVAIELSLNSKVTQAACNTRWLKGHKKVSEERARCMLGSRKHGGEALAEAAAGQRLPSCKT